MTTRQRVIGLSGGATTLHAAIDPLNTANELSTVSVYVAHYDHVLGTSLDLRLVARSKSIARRAEAELLAEVDRLKPILSGWSESSEFTRWQATFEVPMSVSPELAEVLDMCEAWRLRTGGAFDPVMRDGDRPRWVVDRTAGTARRMTEHAASLDAIGKGYIVSRAAGCARDVDGVTDVLLNIGGDVQHFGGQDVAVGVADPFAPADNATPITVVRIRNAALATSGAYRRGPHILDPHTGHPADRIASASVLAADCTTADALSTAFSVMSPNESVALANAILDVGCMLIEHDGTVTTNAAWDARAVVPRGVTINR